MNVNNFPGRLVLGVVVGAGIGAAVAGWHDADATKKQRLSDFKQGVLFGCNTGGSNLPLTEQASNCRELADRVAK